MSLRCFAWSVALILREEKLWNRTTAALAIQDDCEIHMILTGADVTVEPFWPGLCAKTLDGVDVKDLISNIASGVATASNAAFAGDGSKPEVAAAPAKEEKKKQAPMETSDDEDIGFILFD